MELKKDEIAEVVINQLYKQVSMNQMMVGSLLLLGILVNLRSVFGLIPNNEVYSLGLNVVYIIGLAKLLDMSFSMNSEIILMSKYFRYNVMFTVILAVVAVATNWYFIQIYGIEGAAIATGITLAIFNIIKLVFLNQNDRGNRCEPCKGLTDEAIDLTGVHKAQVPTHFLGRAGNITDRPADQTGAIPRHGHIALL